MIIVKKRHIQQNAHLLILFSIATGLFLYHSYTIVERFVKFEILEMRNVVYNESLPMPIVSLTSQSWRHFNSSRPHAQIRFEVKFNRRPIDPLAMVSDHFLIRYETSNTELREDSIYLNSVNASNFDEAKSRSIWPLRIYYATGGRHSGFTITAFVNASTYIDQDENGDADAIFLKVISIDKDPNLLSDSKGVPRYLQVKPCDNIAISITLQRYSFIDRLDSPCRNDYPQEIKSLLMNPMKPEYLLNAMLAPNLPYDKSLCELLCVVKYGLPILNCIVSSDALQYISQPSNSNLKLCDDVALRNRTLPTDIYASCECYKRCSGYEFIVSSIDKIRVDANFVSCSERQKMIEVNVFYTDLSYEQLDEAVAYPKEEMINELAGIFGLYFGFSVVSLAPLFQLALRKICQMFFRESEKKYSKNDSALRHIVDIENTQKTFPLNAIDRIVHEMQNDRDVVNKSFILNLANRMEELENLVKHKELRY